MLAATAASAPAQIVRNPTRIEFTASADHEALLPDGSPVVERYQFEIYLEDAAEPISTVDLGKPTPDEAQRIRAAPAELVGIPANLTFVARVAAIGPGGVARSAPSNPFFRAGPPRPATSVQVIAGGL